MLSSRFCRNGMVVAPHHLAAEAGLAVLRDGGNAAEAAVSVAATLAVVYPHMNGIGGDSFWLVREAAGGIVGIDACGAAGAQATAAFYAGWDVATIPPRGPLAANTVSGTISGWQAVLDIGARWGGRLPLARLLTEAIDHAHLGCPIAESLADMLEGHGAELAGVAGFADTFPTGAAARAGALWRQPRLAATLQGLVDDGLDSFYRGAVAEAVAADLAAVGAPVGLADLGECHATEVSPLSLKLSVGKAFNMPPPTQGAASLMILGLYDRLRADGDDELALIHKVVQATTSAYRVRDSAIGDPSAMTARPADWLAADALDRRAAGIDVGRVAPWGAPEDGGDTVWFGVIDGAGRAISAIQSVFWEFGSGVVLPKTGILWQNRGSSFHLGGGGPRALQPGRKPFHTLNPAMAELGDGRVVVYGTMGGDGQPQSQAAMLARYAWLGQGAQASVTAPRWLMGKTWGQETASLKIESRFAPGTADRLRALGYAVDEMGAFDSLLGHAGMLVRHPSGTLEGGSDPRSDGTVATF
ncbi:MAG: gamma-glutamyltransferase [Alphaproteobacteria bacterium]